jgi:hypothetical protein
MACDAAKAPLPPPGEQIHGDAWDPNDPSPIGPAVLTPGEAGSGKSARRMSVDQLRRSIPALFGGETWTIQINRLEGTAFDLLARTLGEPDYIQVTEANEDPSPLFAKFMDDMAGDVCGKAIERDQTGTGEKLVMRHEDVDANLRFLRLKLHGIYVPDGSMEGLGDLRQLHDELLADGNDPGNAWFGVCVAMLTAPELMAY